MLGGVDLVRRAEGKDVNAMTFTLLTTKEGKKMGKTEKGALWLDRNKTTPYEFFQYWRNVSDDDVIRCLKLLTFVPIEEIETMESWQGNELNKAKEILAYEVTKMVHSKDSILIDDYSGNLREWEKEGGISVRFSLELESKGFKVIDRLDQIIDMF